MLLGEVDAQTFNIAALQRHAATEQDGNFDFVALTDAASCFILGSTPVSAKVAELSRLEARRLLEECHAHKEQWPQTLFVPDDQPANRLSAEAERHGITVVHPSASGCQIAQDSLRCRGFTASLNNDRSAIRIRRVSFKGVASNAHQPPIRIKAWSLAGRLEPLAPQSPRHSSVPRTVQVKLK